MSGLFAIRPPWYRFIQISIFCLVLTVGFASLARGQLVRQDWNRCPVVELLIVDEMECTALENEWDSPPNPLMHPPCLCPKCKVDPIEFEHVPGRLRASGMPQRPAVESLELGNEGQRVL
jgi:hypothetical protein